MKLIVMRHGTCQGLKDSIINGWLDYPLNKHGIYEAETVAKVLKDYNIDKAYTSYLMRAYDTARYIFQKLSNTGQIVKDIRLNERHYGAFQGLKRKEAYKYPEYNTLSLSADRLDNKLIPLNDVDYEEQSKEYSQKLNVGVDELKLPRAESILDVEKRVNNFLDKEILLKKNKDKTILIVSHANVVKLISKRIENLTYEQTTKLRFATCGMKIFDMDITGSKVVVNSVLNINKEWVE